MAPKKTDKSKTKQAHDGEPAQQDEAYQVLARKYRPQNFDDLIGQDAMVRTLQNAFSSGRIAQAYMLTGVRGVGKTTTARILARALNYHLEGSEPTPSVEMTQLGIHCEAIMASRHVDVMEMDAASHTSVDNIRELIESARYKPVSAHYKVYIIDEVHMLSKGAFNALLKTLEEPPEHVKFIFATTEIRKVPVTVLSRCQRFDLRRIPVELLIAHFDKIAKAENAAVSKEALALIASAAEGSVRDGLSLLDQVIALGTGENSDGEIGADQVRAMLGLADRTRIFDILEAVLNGNVKQALDIMQELYEAGADAVQMMGDLSACVHSITRIKAVAGETREQSLSEAEYKRAKELGDKISIPVLSRAWQMVLKGCEEVASAPWPLAAAEMVLVRMAYIADLPTPEDLIKASPHQESRNVSANGKGQEGSGERAGGGAGPQSQDARGVKTSGAPAGSSFDGGGAAQMRDGTSGAVIADNIVAGPGHAVQTHISEEYLDERDDMTALYEANALLDDEAEPALGLASEGLREREEGDGDDDDIGENPLPVFMDFEQVVNYVGKMRDARLKVSLETHCRLVRFREGHIELQLTQGAPKALANELGQKLSQWSGQRWIVAVTREQGGATIAEQRAAAYAEELGRVVAHDQVKALMAAFPDAEVTQIRVGQSETLDIDQEQASHPKASQAENNKDDSEES